MSVFRPDKWHPHDFHVRVANRAMTRGTLHFGGRWFDCALGKTGIISRKREGDGASPCGGYTLLGGFFRADRLAKPASLLPLRPTHPLER